MLLYSYRATGKHEFWSLVTLMVTLGIVVSLHLIQFDKTILLEGDSKSYIEMSPVRTMAYPMFLKILRFLGLKLEMIPLVQFIVYLFAVTFFFFSVRPVAGKLLVLAGFTICISVVPMSTSFHGQIMTESLWISGILFLIGVMSRYLIRPSYQWLFYASLLGGLLATLRPVGASFLPLILLLCLHEPISSRKRNLLVAALPFALVFFSESLISAQVHGSDRSSLLPRHLFAKAALVQANIPSAFLNAGPRGCLHRKLEYDAAPVRELLNSPMGASVKRVVSRNYEVFFQYSFLTDARRWCGSGIQISDGDVTKVAVERLRYGIVSFMSKAVETYLAQWYLFDASHPLLYQEFNEFVSRIYPIPFAEHVPNLSRPTTANKIAWVMRPAIMIVGLTTGILALLGFISVFRRRGRTVRWSLAFLLAIGLHGYVFLVSLTGIQLSRYLFAAWPLIAGSLGFALIALFRGTDVDKPRNLAKSVTVE